MANSYPPLVMRKLSVLRGRCTDQPPTLYRIGLPSFSPPTTMQSYSYAAQRLGSTQGNRLSRVLVPTTRTGPGQTIHETWRVLQPRVKACDGAIRGWPLRRCTYRYVAATPPAARPKCPCGSAHPPVATPFTLRDAAPPLLQLTQSSRFHCQINFPALQTLRTHVIRAGTATFRHHSCYCQPT